jgi:hypothetical protein
MTAEPGLSLVFVYAADGGFWNGVVDTLHKLVSPATYPCSLCALTHGPVGPRPAWTAALGQLGLPTIVLHREELAARHGDVRLPAVLVERDGRLEPLISAAEIDACRDLDALVALVTARARTLTGG